MEYELSISAGINWANDVRDAMDRQKVFVLVGWDYGRHHNQCELIANEFDYDYKLDPEKKRAFFAPKSS